MRECKTFPRLKCMSDRGKNYTNSYKQSMEIVLDWFINMTRKSCTNRTAK